MDKKETFERTVLRIALPVTFQSLLQSSFSVIDQVMIGQLGSNSIAGIGLGGKFASLYSVVLAAIASAAGIMISQYMGRKDEESIGRSFYTNMALSIVLAAAFMLLCIMFPEIIMSVYTKDEITKILAVKYIRILAISFIPMAVSSILTMMLRCMEAAALPLYASIFALLLNTGLNYLLIFGKWIFPELGVEGAALASVAAQIISCVIIFLLFITYKNRQEVKLNVNWHGKEILKEHNSINPGEYTKQYLKILCPLLICEFLWSMGENVYTAIYGNIGTNACAAMTMTIPILTIVIGALSGLSQASGILIGKSLGANKYDQAYTESVKLMKYGFAASIILSMLLVALSSFYVKIYNVDTIVQDITQRLLIVIAIIAPVKVLNMILGGGIIRSGGKTKYTMWIDIIGTWGLGVPLGLLAAFVWKMPIEYVYFVLSMEECARLGISFIVFKKKKWMESIQ
ncbi:MAG: MATE family efflux transporter [Lachnospiraceae bacterium]|nr:MATE family efflux transporter [Lachnospiraceae bacterium]